MAAVGGGASERLLPQVRLRPAPNRDCASADLRRSRFIHPAHVAEMSSFSCALAFAVHWCAAVLPGGGHPQADQATRWTRLAEMKPMSSEMPRTHCSRWLAMDGS